MSCHSCHNRMFGYPQLTPRRKMPKWRYFFIEVIIAIIYLAGLFKLAYPAEDTTRGQRTTRSGGFSSQERTNANSRLSQGKALIASWYSVESLKKEGTWKRSKGRMSNGKLFNENTLTCASRDFPLKTKLRVTNLKNSNKSVIVEVTDKIGKRFAGKRIDLSRVAFVQIGNLKQGIITVKVERLAKGE